MPSAKTLEFSAAVVRWQKRHGRHSLPWNAERDPYKIWVSETMLQQTQAAAVIPYYQKFIRRFPTAAKLARARPDSAMAMWSGLGYYARARRLHSAAKIIAKKRHSPFRRRMAATPPESAKAPPPPSPFFRAKSGRQFWTAMLKECWRDFLQWSCRQIPPPVKKNCGDWPNHCCPQKNTSAPTRRE